MKRKALSLLMVMLLSLLSMTAVNAWAYEAETPVVTIVSTSEKFAVSDTVSFLAYVDNMPVGSSLDWTVSGAHCEFSGSPVLPNAVVVQLQAKGNVTVTATLTSADGRTLAQSSQTITVKAAPNMFVRMITDILDTVGNFFRNLFH